MVGSLAGETSGGEDSERQDAPGPKRRALRNGGRARGGRGGPNGLLLRGRNEFVKRRDESVCDASERYYWLQSPVCLERREDPRAGASSPRLLVQLARKTGCALSRIFGVGLR